MATECWVISLLAFYTMSLSNTTGIILTNSDYHLRLSTGLRGIGEYEGLPKMWSKRSRKLFLFIEAQKQSYGVPTVYLVRRLQRRHSRQRLHSQGNV